MNATTALIHVVDDDEPLRTDLLRLLKEAGFEARGYGSTGDFLLHRLPDRLGCVLLDLRLPGPSGLELQAALNRQGITLPVIFLTGYADVSSSVRAMKAGAVDFLVKPVEPSLLFEAVQSALARDELQRTTRNEADRLRERFASLSLASERSSSASSLASSINESPMTWEYQNVPSRTRRGHVEAQCGLDGRVTEFATRRSCSKRLSGIGTWRCQHTAHPDPPHIQSHRPTMTDTSPGCPKRRAYGDRICARSNRTDGAKIRPCIVTMKIGDPSGNAHHRSLNGQPPRRQSGDQEYTVDLRRR